MELLTIFSATIGFIGALYLLSTTIDRFGKGIYHSGNHQEKREDWYCFFQPSDLLGKDKGTDKDMGKLKSSLTEAEQPEQKRQ